MPALIQLPKLFPQDGLKPLQLVQTEYKIKEKQELTAVDLALLVQQLLRLQVAEAVEVEEAVAELVLELWFVEIRD